MIAKRAHKNLIYPITARNNTFFSMKNQRSIKIWPKNKELQAFIKTVFILFGVLLWILSFLLVG